MTTHHIVIMSHLHNFADVETQQDFAVTEHNGGHCDQYVYSKEDLKMHRALYRKESITDH